MNGRFTGIAGQSRSFIAVLDARNGRLDPSFDAVPNGQVDAVLALGTRFYIGGAFTEVSGRSRAGLAAFDVATGELDPGFSPSTNGNVYNISTDGSRLFVGGRFTEISRSFNNSVASLDPVTGEASQDFRLFLDKDACTLAIHAGKLYIGGEFTKVNEQPRHKMAAVDLATGAVDQAFTPDPDDDVYGLALTNGQLVAGGRFTSAPRIPALHLAAIDAATGAPRPGFVAGTDGDVTALAVSGGRLFAFQKVSARLHPAVAASDLATSKTVARFNAPKKPANARLRFQTIRALVPLGRQVLAGGDISVSRTMKRRQRSTFQLRSGLIALRAGDGTIDFGYNAHTSGPVSALSLRGRSLYVAGAMSRRSGTKLVPRRSSRKGRRLKPRRVPIYRNNLVALEARSGDLVRAFRPAVESEVSALAPAGERLYLAGSFDIVAGRRRDGLAAVDATSGRPVAAFSPQPVGGAISALLPDGRVVIAGRASSTDGAERAVVARLTAAGRLDASFARAGRALVQLGRRSAARAARSAQPRSPTAGS